MRDERNIQRVVPFSERDFRLSRGHPSNCPIETTRMLNFSMTSLPVRLLALDIDGTLLNPQFHISEEDLSAIRRAHAMGVEIVVATGRRHQFALPVAQKLGVDLCLISSNGAVTRSLTGSALTAICFLLILAVICAPPWTNFAGIS